MKENQKLFCQEYLKNGQNGTKAYAKVYKIKDENKAAASASRLLRNVKVSEYIKEIQEEIREKTTVTMEYIVEKAKDVLEKSLQEVPVTKFNYQTKELEETGEYQFDSKGANGALKILGDTIGAFTKKVELNDNTEKGKKIDALIAKLGNDNTD